MIRTVIGVLVLFVVLGGGIAVLKPSFAQEESDSFKLDIEFLKQNTVASLLFVPFGSNPSFARHNLTDAQVAYLCGDASGNFTGDCANIGANFGTVFKTGRYNKARQFGMKWALEIASASDPTSVANAINGEGIENVIVRIGIAGDGIGFQNWTSNGADYVNFIKQVNGQVGGKQYYIIAGPNEPDLESDWFAPECGNAPGTAGPEADAWYPCVGPKLAQYMNAVCSAVKSDPSLSNVKVLSPAFNMTSYSFPGVVKAMDDAGANWSCVDGIAGNLYAAGKSVREYWADEYTGTTLTFFKNLGKEIYITETGGTVKAPERDINEEDFYIHPILGLSGPRDYDTIRDDLARQGYEARCASPGFSITLNQDGVQWMERYLEEENWRHHRIPGEGAIFGGEGHYFESVRRIGVSEPIRSVLEVDYKDVLVPVFRDLEPPAQLKRDLEQYVSYRELDGSTYSDTEVRSAAINSLLSEKQRCTEAVKILIAQDEMCKKLQDPTACTLYYTEIPGTEYTVKSLLDTYYSYARDADPYDACTNILKDPENSLRDGLLNTPLNIERSYRLAFLVTTVRLRYPTTSTMFNFFTHPNAGPIGGPNKPPHTVIINAFKVPDILTNKGTPEGEPASGHTDWNDPEITTRNSLVPSTTAERLDLEGDQQRLQLLERARDVANRDQTSQSEIFCLVGSRTSGIGVPQCMDDLSKAIVDIVNATAELKPDQLECDGFMAEDPQQIVDSATLQPTNHPSRLYQVQFGAALLDNLFSDPAHNRNGAYDPMYGTTGDEDSESPLDDWGIESMFHVTPQLRPFPYSESSDKRTVKHFLVYPAGYDLETIQTVLAGSFFSTDQLTALLEEEKEYDRFSVLQDLLSFDGGEYSYTYTDYTEVCDTETRTDPFTGSEYTVNIYCDRTFGWSIGTDKEAESAGILGGKFGFWQWTIQKTLYNLESLAHKYLEVCSTTEDFLLDQCGGAVVNEEYSETTYCEGSKYNVIRGITDPNQVFKPDGDSANGAQVADFFATGTEQACELSIDSRAVDGLTLILSNGQDVVANNPGNILGCVGNVSVAKSIVIQRLPPDGPKPDVNDPRWESAPQLRSEGSNAAQITYNFRMKPGYYKITPKAPHSICFSNRTDIYEEGARTGEQAYVLDFSTSQCGNPMCIDMTFNPAMEGGGGDIDKASEIGGCQLSFEYSAKEYNTRCGGGRGGDCEDEGGCGFWRSFLDSVKSQYPQGFAAYLATFGRDISSDSVVRITDETNCTNGDDAIFKNSLQAERCAGGGSNSDLDSIRIFGEDVNFSIEYWNGAQVQFTPPSQELWDAILAASQRHGCDPLLTLAVAHSESTHYTNHTVPNAAGALGVFQFIPGAWNIWKTPNGASARQCAWHQPPTFDPNAADFSSPTNVPAAADSACRLILWTGMQRYASDKPNFVRAFAQRGDNAYGQVWNLYPPQGDYVWRLWNRLLQELNRGPAAQPSGYPYPSC